MSSDSDEPDRREGLAGRLTEAGLADRIYWGLLIILQGAMAVELVILLIEKEWLNAFLVLGIMGLTMAPAALAPRLHVRIPAEFQLLAVLFVFATLFLGEMLNYYDRFDWWDTVLHGFSGLLLGVFGFLLVYVLNENRSVDMTLRPGFLAFFAFLFAVSFGTLWEIFEFAMDQLFDKTMQNNSLVDTMWDLIADTISAAAVSLFAWWYLHRHRQFFIERWVHKFIVRNPRLFR
jgi:CDP-diglyceride synthetase